SQRQRHEADPGGAKISGDGKSGDGAATARTGDAATSPTRRCFETEFRTPQRRGGAGSGTGATAAEAGRGRRQTGKQPAARRGAESGDGRTGCRTDGHSGGSRGVAEGGGSSAATRDRSQQSPRGGSIARTEQSRGGTGTGEAGRRGIAEDGRRSGP